MTQFLIGIIMICVAAALAWFGQRLATEGWKEWKHPKSMVQSESSKEPKLKEPTFTEKVDTVRFSLGEGGMTVGYKFSVLEKEGKEPFKFGNFSPVRLYIENGKPFSDATIYGGGGGGGRWCKSK